MVGFQKDCFGKKMECKNPCEDASKCIEETGRIFRKQKELI